jgi:hypothetical protein
VERNIAWSTLNVGITAVASLGKLWSSPESLWVGFRALDILAGLLSKRGTVLGIERLLHPESIRAHVLSALTPEWYRE